MAIHLRIAGWEKRRPAGRRRPRAAAVAVLGAGATALVAGCAILTVNLAPMFGLGAETATMTSVQAAPVPPVTGSMAGLSGSIKSSVRQVITAPEVVDRPVNGVAFQMRIPAIGYSADVVEGVDAKALERGAGHYPTTAWPGRAGNVGVAAHNMYWLSFNRLKAGDRIEIQTPHGLYLYEIIGSRVVEPGDRTVLRSTLEHQLTLTTCYPLWAGVYATRRLIFTAREIGGAG